MSNTTAVDPNGGTSGPQESAGVTAPPASKPDLFANIPDIATQPAQAAKPDLFANIPDVGASKPTAKPDLFANIPDIGAPAKGTLAKPDFWPALVKTASNLGINPEHLWRVMHFESGGKPNNVNPTSGATGLIQFMPSTARDLGTTTGALRSMTPEQQLPYVENYLRGNGVTPGMNFADLYSAVLWPKAVGQSGDYVLFKKGTAAYAQNAGLDTGHKGYVTKNDAAMHAWGPVSGASIAAPPWEQPGTPAPPIIVKDANTGKIIDAPAPAGGSPYVLAPNHQQNQVDNLSSLPFNIPDYLLAVEQKKAYVEPKGGWTSNEGRISLSDAAAKIAQAMGYPMGYKLDPHGQQIKDLNGVPLLDVPAKQSFLNPHDPAFAQLRHLANRAGYTPERQEVQDAENMRDAGVAQGQAGGGPGGLLPNWQRSIVDPAVKTFIANHGGAANVAAMGGPEYGLNAVSDTLSPAKITDYASGHFMPESQKPDAEKSLDNIYNALAIIATGGAAGGAEGFAAAGTRAAAGKVAAQMAAKFLATQAAFMAPQAGARALELSRTGDPQTGLQAGDTIGAIRQATSETGTGFAKSFDPRTFFNPEVPLSDKVQAGIMQGLTLLGLGGHALGKLGEMDQYSQIQPPAEPLKMEGIERPDPLRAESPLHTNSPTEGMPGHIMVSPNVEEGLSYDQAAQKLAQPEHAQGRETAQGIADARGMKGHFTDAIGDWVDGAENTLIGRFDPSHTLDELRKTAAQTGQALDQKDALAIKPEADGPHLLTTFEFPRSNYSEPQVRELLTEHGMEHRTIESTPDLIRATIYRETPDQAFYENSSRLGDLDGVKFHASPTAGGFLTGVEGDRDAANAAYSRILGGETEPGSQIQREIPEASTRGGHDSAGGARSQATSGGAGETAGTDADRVVITQPAPPKVETGGLPSAEPTTDGPQPSLTGIRKSVIDSEAASRGVALKEQQAYTTPKTAHEQGALAFKDGTIDPYSVAKEVSAKPRQITPQEVGAFEAAHVDLLGKENRLKAAIERTPSGSEEHERLSANMRTLLQQHEDLIDGLRKGRRENSAGLYALSMMSNLDDGSYAGAMSLARSIKGDALSPKEEGSIRAIQSKLDQVSGQLSESQRQLQLKHDQLTEALAQQRLRVEQRTVQRAVARGDIQQRKTDAIERIKKAVASAPVGASPFAPLPEFMGGLKDLAVAAIHEGALTLAEVHERVSEQLKKHGIEVSMRQVNQALAGYYDAPASTPREAELRVRELRSQARLLSQINDAIGGQGPRTTSKAADSATVAGMRETLKQLIKAQGLKSPEDPTVRLNRAISDALDALEHGPAEASNRPADSPEVSQLRARLSSIRDQIRLKYGDDPEVTRLKSLEKQTADKLDQVEKMYRNRRPVGVNTEAVQAAKAKLDDASKQARVQDRIFEIERQIREKDFPQPKSAPEIPQSPELQKLKDQETHLKAQRQQLIQSMAKPTWMDRFMSWRKALLLSSPSILGKMLGTTASYIAMTPLEDLVGNSYAPLLKHFRPEFYKAAQSELTFNPMAYAKGTIDMFHSLVDGDTVKKFTTGINKMDAEEMARGGKAGVHGSPNVGLLNVSERIHGMLHNPIERFAYTTEATKLTTILAKSGVDVAKPEVIDAINGQAYQKALEAALIHDSGLSRFLQGITKSAGTNLGPLGKGPAEYLLPFKRVSSNIVGRMAEYAGGGPHALARLLFTDVGPEEAPAIARQLKRGTTFGALMLAGIYAYNKGLLTGGGAYDPVTHKDTGPNGKRYDEIQIAGHQVPKDSVLGRILRYAITIAQVKANHVSAGETAVRVGKDALEQVPGLNTVNTFTDQLDRPGKFAAALGRETAGNFVPQIGAYAAGQLDPQQGDRSLPGFKKPRPLKEDGFIQGLLSTVPGMRNKIPTKPAK